MIASLTEHALYVVLHHCIRKTLFSSVHTNDKPAIQKKAPLCMGTVIENLGFGCLKKQFTGGQNAKTENILFGYVWTGPKFLIK